MTTLTDAVRKAGARERSNTRGQGRNHNEPDPGFGDNIKHSNLITPAGKNLGRQAGTRTGSPVDVDDDNVADAVNFNMIGRAMLGWKATENEAQRAIVAELNAPPKVKVKKPRKKAA